MADVTYYAQHHYRIREEVLSWNVAYRDDPSAPHEPQQVCRLLATSLAGNGVLLQNVLATPAWYHGCTVRVPNVTLAGAGRYVAPAPNKISNAQVSWGDANHLVYKMEARRSDGKRIQANLKIPGLDREQIDCNSVSKEYVDTLEPVLELFFAQQINLPGARTMRLCIRSNPTEGGLEFPIVTERRINRLIGSYIERVPDRSPRKRPDKQQTP